MKNIFLLAIGSAIIFLASCRQVNEELISKMDAESANVKQYMPYLDSLHKISGQLTREMEEAPPKLKMSPAYNFVELYMQARGINDRSLRIKDLCTTVSTQLDSLAREYSEGRIEEDSVKVAFEALSASTKGLSKVRKQMQPRMDAVSSDFSKLLETWNALPEAEQNKAAQPGASTPQPGAAATQPGRIGIPSAGAPAATQPQKRN